MKNQFLYFLNKQEKWLTIVGIILFGLLVGLKPIPIAIFTGLCLILVLFFRCPELGLFLFAILIPLHVILVQILKLFPGIWKEFLLGLIVVLWLSKGIMNKKLAVAKTKINLPFSLFILWCFLLLLVNINNFETNIIGLRNLLQYSLLFILAVNLISHKSSIKKYILVISIVAVAAAITNSFLFVLKPEIFTSINRVVVPTFPIKGISTRMIPVAFMGAEHYAYYMSMSACLLIGFLLFVRSKLLKIILMIGIGSLVFSALLTGTRGGILALLCAVIFFGIRYNRKLLFAVIILCFIVAMFLLPPEMHQRYISGAFGGSVGARLFMISNALKVASASPIWGIGLGEVGMAAGTEDYLSTPHNYYCYLALQIGFVGLIIYLWILVIFFKTALFLYNKIERGYFKGLMAGIIMFFIAFSVSALFVGSGESFLAASFYWLFGGFVMVLDREMKHRTEAPLSESKFLPSGGGKKEYEEKLF